MEQEAMPAIVMNVPKLIYYNGAYITQSEAYRRSQISASMKGNPKVKKTCPHCGKVIAAHLLARYHGDKCKFKTGE